VLVVFDTGTAGKGTMRVPEARPTPASTSSATSTQSSTSTPTRSRVLAAPAVRKRAFELGIDLDQVPSSHPSGRVTMEDVQAYAARMKNAAATVSPAPSTPPAATSPSNGATRTTTAPAVEHKAAPTVPAPADERQPLTGLRRRVAERMERSWRTIPHASAFDEVDGTELRALRQALKPVAEQRGVRLTYMPLLVKLLIPVLKEFPIFNASLDEEKREIVYKRSYHIGIAADTPEGLLVPVLRNADQLTLMEVATQLEHLIEAAQKRTLTMSEAGGSTFTLNNVGSFGGSGGAPIINYPEAAILLVGRMQEKAIVREGAIVVQPMMPLVMSFDHRLIDGALAGKFLARFKELVEHPQRLMLDML
jgi:pyruvate dehydrogenase E2 component (dihydrolipoamide acetyltransferase)